MEESFESKRRRFLKSHPNFVMRKGLKGVAWHQSVFYYFVEFLKLSTEYKDAVAAGGSSNRRIQALYEDFGDIYSVTFKDWWQQLREDGTRQGKFCFAEKALLLPVKNADASEVKQYISNIESGEVIAFLLDGNATKTDMKKRVNVLIDRYVDSRVEQVRNQSSARYKVSDYTKNNVDTLRQGIRALQLKELGFKQWQIGVILRADAYIIDDELRKYDGLLPCSQTYTLPKYNESEFERDMLFVKRIDGKLPHRYLIPFQTVTPGVGRDFQVQRNHFSNNAKRALDTAKNNLDAVLSTRRGDALLGFGEFPVSSKDDSDKRIQDSFARFRASVSASAQE